MVLMSMTRYPKHPKTVENSPKKTKIYRKKSKPIKITHKKYRKRSSVSKLKYYVMRMETFEIQFPVIYSVYFSTDVSEKASIIREEF